MKTRKKYDFVGHITYPLNEETKNFFFKQNVTKKRQVVKHNGVEVSAFWAKMSDAAELVNFLKDVGYEVEEVAVKGQESGTSIPSLKIHCVNKECRHFSATIDGVCTIPIKADKEKITYGNKIIEQNIVVSYGASDMREITTKSECILWYINDVLRCQGFADVYGKMEMC